MFSREVEGKDFRPAQQLGVTADPGHLTPQMLLSIATAAAKTFDRGRELLVSPSAPRNAKEWGRWVSKLQISFPFPTKINI